MKRLVVKIGTNVLTRPDGTLDVTRVSALVDQVVSLRGLGYAVVIVSSGAVACGRTELRLDDDLDSVEQRQLYSAVGQVRLMDLYYRLFRDYGLQVGQILTTKRNFETGRERDNQRACMEVMLQHGVVPIVNENDTVSVTELMFTDNDELSGLIAGMVGAEALVLLSNIAGIYDRKPDDPGARIIRTIRPDDDFSACISEEKSAFGRGGMFSKYNTARRVAAGGIRVLIADGKREGILTDLMEHPEDTVHTEILPTI
ncbi:MAG: glutamate 5-kinase [Bacteroidales bacterium]|nr:glutamate 5-kinase [Bacteroidales bacterium]